MKLLIIVAGIAVMAAAPAPKCTKAHPCAAKTGKKSSAPKPPATTTTPSGSTDTHAPHL